MMVSLVGHFLGKGGQYPQQGLGTYWQQYVPGRSYHTSSCHNPSSGVHTTFARRLQSSVTLV